MFEVVLCTVLVLLFGTFCLSSFAIILMGKRERAGCFILDVISCLLTVSNLRFFLTVPWVGLQCVIVVFPDHNHLPFS